MIETSFVLRADEALLSVHQVAALLAVSRLTVYRLIERGTLPVFRVARRLRFSRGDIARYLEQVRAPHQYGGPEA